MKKILKSVIVLFVLFVGVELQAQYTTTIPLDPKVKHGKLSNGMTYYVMHNEEPKDRVMLMFVQNVGAILEEDSQNGLAHFLEHMAFNGLEHYPGKSMLNYLEKNGIEFGRDINAYTAQDETVYYINNIPTDHENLIDSSLLVLHDWSGSLLLEGDEIDAERGVIHEEWRTRRDARFRLNKLTTPVLYNNSKYVERDVIGDTNVIDGFKYQELRNYYKKWYRPDLQAVVVVGDIDADLLEKKIKDVFSSIPVKENPAERVYYNVEDSKETGYVLATDKEAGYVSINWLFRSDVDKVRDENYLRKQIVKDMFRSMLNSRYGELLQKPECPAMHLGIGGFDMARTKNADYLIAVPKENKEKESFTVLLTEFEKVRRYGFTSSELERLKKQLIRDEEAFYADKEKISNNEWAEQFANHFLKASPVPEILWNVEFSKKTISDISLDEVNKLAEDFININNSVLSVSGPDKDGMNFPSKEELLAIYKQVAGSEIEEYKDDADDSPLVKDKLKKEKVTQGKELSVKGAKKYTLKNGATVIVYPTDYSKDEVLFTATSFGGSSLLSIEDLYSSDMAASMGDISGVGDFDAIQLKKKLSGKIANLSLGLGAYTEDLKGAASPKDLETLLQLIYLSFEHPRFDESAFESQLDNLRNYLVNLKTDNGQAFNDTVGEMVTDHNPRNLLFNEEFVKNVSFEKAKAIYLDRFKNASDFKFIFVGNIDEKKDLPLIFKYIGNISGNGKQESWKDNNVRPADGFVENNFGREMQVEKSTVFYGIYGNVDYNLKNRMYVRVISALLDKRYLETIREQEGGSYGVSVWPSILKLPYEHYEISIKFDCDPEKQARLYEIVKQEIDKLITEGVNRDDLNEIKENYINNREEQSKQNRFWLSVIKNSEIYNEPIVSDQEYNELVKSINEKDIQAFAKEIFKDPDTVKVVMYPKGKK